MGGQRPGGGTDAAAQASNAPALRLARETPDCDAATPGASGCVNPAKVFSESHLRPTGRKLGVLSFLWVTVVRDLANLPSPM